jgi:hypothetical protein
LSRIFWITARSAGNTSSSPLAVAGVVVSVDPPILRTLLRARYATSAEFSDQAILIRGLRSVDDGFSPKTVR